MGHRSLGAERQMIVISCLDHAAPGAVNAAKRNWREHMDGLSKKLRARIPKPSHIIDIADYDHNAKYLLGWPGYRTSQNKSGLGYMETQAEMAHMQGLFIVWLVTGKFRTHNPIFLLGMLLFGLLCGGIPTVFMIYEVIANQNWDILKALLMNVPYIVSVLILINALLSIFNRKGQTITGD